MLWVRIVSRILTESLCILSVSVNAVTIVDLIFTDCFKVLLFKFSVTAGLSLESGSPGMFKHILDLEKAVTQSKCYST